MVLSRQSCLLAWRRIGTAEKRLLELTLRASAPPAHGSMPLAENSNTILAKAIRRFSPLLSIFSSIPFCFSSNSLLAYPIHTVYRYCIMYCTVHVYCPIILSIAIKDYCMHFIICSVQSNTMPSHCLQGPERQFLETVSRYVRTLYCHRFGTISWYS